MNPHDNARLAASRAWKQACWDVRSAELRHGVGSEEWMAACKRERKLQDAYYRIKAAHEAADRQLYKLDGAVRF